MSRRYAAYDMLITYAVFLQYTISGISFSFKKKNTGPKVQAVNKRGFEKVEEDKDDIEIITGVDEKGIAGTKPKEVKEELVIPLIQSE